MPNLDQPAKDLVGGVESGDENKQFLKGPMLFDEEGIRVLGREEKGERRWNIPAATNGAAAGAPAPASDGEKASETATAAAPAPAQQAS